MNDKAVSRGPGWGLLLLVPAAVIVAKAAMHRRAVWESGWAVSGAGTRRYGHHRRFGGGEVADEGPSGFRLPPRIEWMLDTWHARAHQATGSTMAPEDLPAPEDAPKPGSTDEPRLKAR